MNFFIVSLIKAGLVAAVLLTKLANLQWIERKMLAHIQLRVGPYRVGPHGLLQPLADVIKLVTKEGMIPSHVNKLFYLLAPFLAVMLSLVSISVIPFGPEINVFGVRTWMQLSDLDIGVLFVLAISSVGVYGVALAGWASNNKYSLIGGLRSSAQMISYELPLALAVAAPLLLANTLSFRELVDHQTGFYWGFIPHWNLWPQIVGFLIFLIAGFAETNRVPFDLPEAENELVAGFHVEYSSMTFAAFFMAEYANMLTVTCVATLLLDSARRAALLPRLVLTILFAALYWAVFTGNPWVAANAFNIRYFFPVLLALVVVIAAPVAAALLTERQPLLGRISSTTLALVTAALAAVASIAGPLTPPSQSMIIQATKATADYARANDVIFVAGYYWLLWPVMVQTLDQGRTSVYGTGDRSDGDPAAYRAAFDRAMANPDSPPRAICVGNKVSVCQKSLDDLTRPGWRQVPESCPVPSVPPGRLPIPQNTCAVLEYHGA